jgi:hypothetical protein
VTRFVRLFRLPGLFRLLGLVCVLAHIACGQKGAPLAPIVLLPRPVSEVVVKRIENDIVLQFQVPTLNTDGSGPADLRKIEVYGHTGPLPKPEDFIKYGDRIASIEVKQPPDPAEPGAEGAAGATGVTGAMDAEGALGATGAPDVAGATQKPVSPKQAAEDAAKAGLVEQGWTITVRETLTPKHWEIGPMPPVRPPPPPDPDAPVVVVEKIETPGTVNFDLPQQRNYVLVGVSDSRNKRGPFAGPIQVALLDPLSPPEKIDFTYTADTVSLSWPGRPEDIPMTTPVGLHPRVLGLSAEEAAAAANAPVAPITPVAPVAPAPPLDRETEGTRELYADVETEDTDDVLVAVVPAQTTGAKPKPTPALRPQPPPTPRFGYNVYEAGATGAMGAIGATGATTPAPDASTSALTAQTASVDKPAPTAPVIPINARLLTAPGFADPRVEFGVERCYVVRRVQMVGGIAVESAPSAPTCVTPVDTFPPNPPKSLALIAGGNGVSLLWEGNTEADLGGYLVLRGEAPGDKLSPLTKEPIAETSFLDTTARRGRTYVYRVVAVDRATPPNRSAPSEPVEETIR